MRRYRLVQKVVPNIKTSLSKFHCNFLRVSAEYAVECVRLKVPSFHKLAMNPRNPVQRTKSNAGTCIFIYLKNNPEERINIAVWKSDKTNMRWKMSILKQKLILSVSDITYENICSKTSKRFFCNILIFRGFFKSFFSLSFVSLLVNSFYHVKLWSVKRCMKHTGATKQVTGWATDLWSVTMHYHLQATNCLCVKV